MVLLGKSHVTRTYFRALSVAENLLDGKTVVDVGCGNGRIGRLVAPFAREYIGLDLWIQFMLFRIT